MSFVNEKKDFKSEGVKILESWCNIVSGSGQKVRQSEKKDTFKKKVNMM